MALSTPSASPAVVVKEIDLTGGVPNVQSTTGAIVGNFRWGPIGERVAVANETELVNTFASPDSDNTIDWHSASYFLRYSSSLLVTREADGAAKNAYSRALQSVTSTVTAPLVENETDFEAQFSNLDNVGHTFVAKYAGELGNSLEVQICPADSGNSQIFNNWAYKNEFDEKPVTSNFAIDQNATFDEMHVVVLDRDGKITGTRGEILETYPFLSVAENAKNPDGSTNFAIDVINARSDYIKMINFDSDYLNTPGEDAGQIADSGDDYILAPGALAIKTFNFDSGVNSGILGTAEYLNGYDLYEDRDIVEVDFLIAPSLNNSTDQTTVVNDLVTTAQSLRKDCVVVSSPARDDIVGLTNASTITDNIVDTANALTNSSYLVFDGNFLKVYDKFNDQYINIPAASSTAGIMAATDLNRAPWFSPAGSRRGQYLGITALNWTPTKGQRDTLYKAGVNPIANIPGQGSLLFGDKTKLGRPSAFDRINVRRLFLVLERAIGRAAEQALFEFNDEFTRAEFVNIVEPVLREVKGRRGITDFRVVCDETNNTPAVVDRNEFIANIFIKPARSINYITLNFVAVRTGVDFEEVVGTV